MNDRIDPFSPIRLGSRKLRNHIVMAPMTRSRAYGPGATPTADMANYYAQRAGAGLIVTEGIQPSAIGQGYPDTPGLHSRTQVEAWRRVTHAVHEAGGVIYAQLMHTGRIAHPDNYSIPMTPVGASAVRAAGQIFTRSGPQDLVEPRSLGDAEVKQTIADFATAAQNAVAAGFDGVELHGANGYLLHQFLSTSANLRQDRWGGTAEARVRLPVEVVRAVAHAIGPERTALRISPANPAGDIVEDDHRAVYRLLVKELNPIGLSYLHLLETTDPGFTPELRAAWSSLFVLNPATPEGTTGPEHLALIENGSTDLLSFGRLFIANPDLPRRLALGAPLAQPDMSRAYGGDETGYTDYPLHAQEPDPRAS